MKLRRLCFNTLAGILLCAGLQGAVHADTIQITGISHTNLSTPSNGSFYNAGLSTIQHPNTANLQVTTSTVGSFMTFCLDPHQIFGTGTYNRVLADDHFQFANINDTQTHLMQRLWFDAFSGSSLNASTAAAFQYAVWEIANDGGVIDLASPASLSNRIAITPASALYTQTMALLTAALAPGGETPLYVLENATTQDLVLIVSTNPVPEPSTWAMLLSCFGLMGFIGRRSMHRA